ncbi:hypothetical protein [Paenibacillus qinlingensis]|uniref:hypothetical protein n=1 Tax=Paenibacillus qinlingensis TaxID=1837343 RepID=UPI0015639FE1|nr:hypothetical protein [Paenibacillus qinlingensis]NQX57531.1 hypothetical protein [Paenibacillus qinlingensis]
MLQLSRKEAAVYEKLGAGALPRDIASKIGVHRITVMYFINKLVISGAAKRAQVA